MDEIVEHLLPYVISMALALISGLCAVCVRILWRLASNIAELNEKIAVIMSEMTHSNQRADRIDADLKALHERLWRLERTN